MNDILYNIIIKSVSSVTTMYSDIGARSKRTNRERFAVVIKYEGETIYDQGGEKTVSNINNIVLLPRGSDYEWRCIESGHFISLEFEADQAFDKIISFPLKNINEILDMMKKLEAKLLSKKPTTGLESIRDAYSILIKIHEASMHNYAPNAKALKLASAIDYINRNYTASLKNDELAALTRLSTVYFRKLFSEVYGISALEYAKKLRIKKAKEMLHGDYGSITEIATSLGYMNIYDFSRDFKKRVGVSPSKYIL